MSKDVRNSEPDTPTSAEEGCSGGRLREVPYLSDRPRRDEENNEKPPSPEPEWWSAHGRAE